MTRASGPPEAQVTPALPGKAGLDVVDRIFRAWALARPAPEARDGDDVAAVADAVADAVAVVQAFVAADEATREAMRRRVDGALYTPTEVMQGAAIPSADSLRERRRQADERGLRFVAFAAHGVRAATATRDAGPLFLGLAGLALTGGFPDWRDAVPALDDTHRAAITVGADPAALFTRAAALATDQMRGLLQTRAGPVPGVADHPRPR